MKRRNDRILDTITLSSIFILSEKIFVRLKKRDFIFLGSKITADGDCHEIKRCLLLGRKAMTNLDSIVKSRNIAEKGLTIQSYGFSCSHVWMWESDHEESWQLKKWCFWTVVLEKTLESPLNNKEFKSLILKKISPEYSLEGLIMKLKLQCFGHWWEAITTA